MNMMCLTPAGVISSCIMNFLYGNPFGFKETTENEMRIQNRNSRDPEQGPKREPGDFYILLCTVIGIVVGCTAGVVIGARIAGNGGLFLGLVGGLIIGGFAGVAIGSYLKNRRGKKYPLSGGDVREGPFVK